MLVYANYLSFRGAGADEAIFKAIGAWLKEQLDFGLHPDQLRQEGEFNGYRGETRSSLRIYATREEQPELYSWVLKNADDVVYGRQWIAEVGLKKEQDSFELSCIVRTDEHSTLVVSPVVASQPRVIRYVVNNIQQADDADFAVSVPGLNVKTVGQDLDSYRGLLAEIERRGRDTPVVLVSPTRDGEYLISVWELQQRLIGLAQVVQVTREFNSYDMADILGQPRSAWGGAVNVLNAPTRTGFVRSRYFLPDAIEAWGDTPHQKNSQILALVTNNTNILRLRKHIRPEGVMQLALRRRLQNVRARGEQMDAAQLREELEKSSKVVAEQTAWIAALEEDNSSLQSDISDTKARLGDEQESQKKQNFVIQTLKTQLQYSGKGRTSDLDVEELVDLVSRPAAPTPLECIELIDSLYGDKCTVLESARETAREMDRFIYGRQLLELLKKLATDYRSKLMESGDNEARKVFGKSEYAAKESETVMGNKDMRRQRTFEYEGEQVEMFRHLKIGVDDDVTKTIRVHFHWDAERNKIVIGYCGEHLSVSGH
ncbi:MAG: hypothetical protein WCC21_12680 [Candidatus Acidiferrales bacterium]